MVGVESHAPSRKRGLTILTLTTTNNRPLQTGENAPLLLDAPTTAPSCSRASAEPDVHALIAEVFGADLDMASFLVETAGRNSTIANFLYW